MKTLIEIHVLQNFAPANLNRDDTGAPKDAWFGGTRRARISSQCIKRAVREYFKELVNQGTLGQEDVAVRTKRLLDALTECLAKKERDNDEAKEKVKLAMEVMSLPAQGDDGKNQYLLFLGQREIANVANIIDEKWKDITASDKEPSKEKKTGKDKKQEAKNANPALKKALDEVFNGGKAVDLALFGRMLADMPEKNRNASCQVAHAISTHAVEREFDFYTAIDDRKPEDTSGADMMGTVEFNSACFYRYAVIDWKKLVDNLQDDKKLAEKGLRAFLEGFVVAEPTGKQNTFAAHNPPEFVAISVRHNTAPCNLANAFEKAIWASKNESITEKSAIELVKRASLLLSAYGEGEQTKKKTFVLNLVNTDLNGFGNKADSLDDLLNKTMKEFESGKG